MKNLNDIRKLKPHVLKKPTDEEILEVFSKPIKHGTNSDLLLVGSKTAEELKKVFDEYEKGRNK
ncbi:MAG: hypothetical protein ACOC22_02305 [bacterium]